MNTRLKLLAENTITKLTGKRIQYMLSAENTRTKAVQGINRIPRGVGMWKTIFKKLCTFEALRT